MCLVLYLASNGKLPAIDWDASAPSFYVTPNDPAASNAAAQFTKTNLAYVGSDNGCGCGFRAEHDYAIDDPEQLASKTDNQRRLHDYLVACLSEEGSVELFSCWSGDESLPREHERTVKISELLSEDFFFLERQLTIVTADSDFNPPTTDS
ncbi:hypothetical protein [Aporhodopirellula aestuarii]|uniref:Uncharacterized protein n=1 Tax=Aporhodopirellula aestuarii TaxID=2950107 RepID=A0ABT0U680_9BACT|nr:hypothetical protein [Aporhodopirellula aestuarii]MCM2372390.1 hypothetical protein [Aporhodopirellula aestuarii]